MTFTSAFGKTQNHIKKLCVSCKNSKASGTQYVMSSHECFVDSWSLHLGGDLIEQS